ncbi:leucyl/phenylalanyl-tRNA--protein transferase [Glaciecola siphonariae]|uniref:Leucyl/phenylalanyl-tRNA--protein transferase n=1 Tax=Glaciecola siphonariae TaxID=521012 RepID=A0ABV9LT25_9ALTE
MLELFRLDHRLQFPAVDLALSEPNGLLAFGGDLNPQRLLQAYRQGIFPWFGEGEPLLWWSPDPRGVIMLDDFSPSKSLKKSIRKFAYSASMNKCFEEVISLCSKVPRRTIKHDDEEHANTTWITDEMIDAYTELHHLGWAHSVEIWDKEQKLVGGLYGIAINGGFCGESMFHLRTDASKAAFFALAQHMRKHGMDFIDCQMVNPHLASLGCTELPRKDFMQMWQNACSQAVEEHCWHRQDLALT